MLCFKEYLKCAYVWNTKWYDLVRVSQWVQHWSVHMLLETSSSSLPRRILVSFL
jgi:hypothetical protein